MNVSREEFALLEVERAVDELRDAVLDLTAEYRRNNDLLTRLLQ